MVAETLCALGRPDAVMPWVVGYATRLEPRLLLTAADSIGDDWTRSLGRFETLASWISLFEDELVRWPARDVLERWAPKLAPGLSGAALHGWLRTAHAWRALCVLDCRATRRELANGLAYWAARYFPLPTKSHAERGTNPNEALKRASQLGPRSDPVPQDMMSGLVQLHAHRGEFAGVINLLHVPPEHPVEVISGLTEAFACAFVENQRGLSASVAFLHAITASSAMRLLIPDLSIGVAREVVQYVWQAVAGLYVALARVSCRRTRSPRPATGTA
jgi:hypothetical protein